MQAYLRIQKCWDMVFVEFNLLGFGFDEHFLCHSHRANKHEENLLTDPRSLTPPPLLAPHADRCGRTTQGLCPSDRPRWLVGIHAARGETVQRSWSQSSDRPTVSNVSASPMVLSDSQVRRSRGVRRGSGRHRRHRSYKERPTVPATGWTPMNGGWLLGIILESDCYW